MPQFPSLSIVIPVLNESASIVSTLEPLAVLRSSGAEVIVVDAGSRDDTVALASPLCDRVMTSQRGRAQQMNAGAAHARGDILLFLHADTRLPEGAGGALADFVQSRHSWGRFDVRLSGRRPLFRLIALLMNLRSRWTGIATGDQAIFVRRDRFEALGGFAPIPLMEDVELCARLKACSRPYCVRLRVVTDSRRWEQQGAWRTILLMWRLRWRYWRGADPAALAEAYRADVRRPGRGKNPAGERPL